MRIGLVYDRFGDTDAPDGAAPDWNAEHEPEATIAALEAALRHAGHVPVRLGPTQKLLRVIGEGDIRQPPLSLDAGLSIAEGFGIAEGGSRNREAHAPVLFELAGVPAFFSDALALSVSLDKALTKTIVAAGGLRTPEWLVIETIADVDAAPLPAWPLFVKPRYEGTARGVAPTSLCENVVELRMEVERQLAIYRQPLIVERFIPGAELTCSVIGTGAGAAAGPALQRAVERETSIGLHALGRWEDPAAPFEYDTPAVLTPELEAALRLAAVAAHRAIDARDVSRSDFRLDSEGQLWFLEINTLPTFAPDSTFAVEAVLSNTPYVEHLASVFAPGLTRVNEEVQFRTASANGVGGRK